MALLRLIPRPRVQVCVLALPRPPTLGLTLGRRGLAPPWDLLSAPFLCMTLYAVSMLQKKKNENKKKTQQNHTFWTTETTEAERSVPACGPVAASPCSGLCAAVFCQHEVQSPLKGWRGGGVTPSMGYGGSAISGPCWVSFDVGLAKPFGPELSEVSRSQATQGQARSPGCQPGERWPGLLLKAGLSWASVLGTASAAQAWGGLLACSGHRGLPRKAQGSLCPSGKPAWPRRGPPVPSGCPRLRVAFRCS